MAKNTLNDFQQQLSQHLLSPQLEPSSELLLAQFKSHFTPVNGEEIADDLTEARTRLDIYRNNVIHSLSCAIGDLYPIVKRLVGEQFFNGLAIEFVRLYPPDNSALVLYGQGFVKFIAKHQACAQLPYLSDVAQLELICHQCFHAIDCDNFEPSQLASIAPEQLGFLTFTFDPAVHLLQSNWPVEAIWQENLKAQPQQLNIDQAGGCYLLVFRREFEVQVVDLNPHCFNFISQLKSGLNIAQAWQATLLLAQKSTSEITESLNEDELGPMLGYLFGLPLFNDFRLQEQ